MKILFRSKLMLTMSCSLFIIPTLFFGGGGGGNSEGIPKAKIVNEKTEVLVFCKLSENSWKGEKLTPAHIRKIEQEFLYSQNGKEIKSNVTSYAVYIEKNYRTWDLLVNICDTYSSEKCTYTFGRSGFEVSGLSQYTIDNEIIYSAKTTLNGNFVSGLGKMFQEIIPRKNATTETKILYNFKECYQSSI